jgi:hypothetical protein
MSQTIYNYDDTGKLIGHTLADESPLEPQVFLIPANATMLVPPSVLAGQFARFHSNAWTVETIPVPIPVTPAQPSLTDLKAQKRAEIDLAADTAISPITTVYSQSERDTWPIQESEAVEWSANNAAPTPMLSAIASQRSMTIAVLAASVLTKAAGFKVMAGATFGKRRAKIDLLEAAATAAAVNVIVW